jgi:hypothetical protein
VLLSDLAELKAILGIPQANTTQDAKLAFFVEQASNWIGELLGRPAFSKRSRTEFYRGTGTARLPLKNRPVYPTPTPRVWYDSTGYYGASSGAFADEKELTYGVDFTAQWDQDDGSSRSGILVRIGNAWARPFFRQAGLLSPFQGQDTGSIKVVYTGGWTVDNLPSVFRMALTTLVARMNYIFPLGMELSSESYEDRSVSFTPHQKSYLMGLVAPMILPYYANWSF